MHQSIGRMGRLCQMPLLVPGISPCYYPVYCTNSVTGHGSRLKPLLTHVGAAYHTKAAQESRSSPRYIRRSQGKVYIHAPGHCPTSVLLIMVAQAVGGRPQPLHLDLKISPGRGGPGGRRTTAAPRAGWGHPMDSDSWAASEPSAAERPSVVAGQLHPHLLCRWYCLPPSETFPSSSAVLFLAPRPLQTAPLRDAPRRCRRHCASGPLPRQLLLPPKSPPSLGWPHPAPSATARGQKEHKGRKFGQGTLQAGLMMRTPPAALW